MNRVIAITGGALAAFALSLSVAGSAEAATVSPTGAGPDNAADSMYTITMYVDNDSSSPLTLFTSSHNHDGHWQQQSPTVVAKDSSVTVTAYTNNPAGFEATLDYLTPDGHSVLMQAVNYVGESDTAGDSNTDDPALSLQTSVLGGMSGDYYYLVQNAS
jgi:hypothetical protein